VDTFVLRWWYYAVMDEALLKRALQEIGKRGGDERAKRLTGKRRKEIATKASKAAAKARTRKAKERKRVHESEQQ
jgi:hypothetical protein